MRPLLFLSPVVPPFALPESIAILKKLRSLAGQSRVRVIGASADGAPFAAPIDPSLNALMPASLDVHRLAWPRLARLAGKVDSVSLPVTGHSRVLRPRYRVWARAVRQHAADSGWFTGFGGMITNSSPVVSHLVGLAIRARNPDLPWLQHYSDPFVDPVYQWFHPAALAVDRHYERRCIERGDFFTFTTPETIDAVAARLPAALASRLRERSAVVPHVYDDEIFTAAEQAFPSETLSRDALNVSCLGHFYGSRSFAPICRLLDGWRQRGGTAGDRPLHVHVFGTMRAADAERVRDAYPEVRLHGTVGYLRSLAVMRASDALLLADAPAPSGVSIYFPSKLVEYLGAGRPIVAITPKTGATARIARETGHLVIDIDRAEHGGVELRSFLHSQPRSTARPAQYRNGVQHSAPMIAFFRSSGAVA